VRGELGQQTVGGVDELLVHLLRQGSAGARLVGHRRRVDAVVRGKPTAELLEHGAARRARDEAKPEMINRS